MEKLPHKLLKSLNNLLSVTSILLNINHLKNQVSTMNETFFVTKLKFHALEILNPY